MVIASRETMPAPMRRSALALAYGGRVEGVSFSRISNEPIKNMTVGWIEASPRERYRADAGRRPDTGRRGGDWVAAILDHGQ